jgi:hypothetical protein
VWVVKKRKEYREYKIEKQLSLMAVLILEALPAGRYFPSRQHDERLKKQNHVKRKKRSIHRNH